MSTITCLKELEEKGILELNDIVVFYFKEDIIEYIVKEDYLNCKFYKNDEIFEILKINKNKIAKKTYNYKTDIENKGFWPESKINDYLALTRLVKELYRIIEERKPKYTKYNRFEIMDI